MTTRRPNYVGIIVGAIVLFAWGAIWYTIFGTAWIAALGKSKEELTASGFWPYVVSFIAGLFVAYCMDNMLWHYEHGNAAKGAQVGLLVGVCIYAAMLFNLYSFQARSINLMLIDAGYGVIGIIITGAVVGALRARSTGRIASPAT